MKTQLTRTLFLVGVLAAAALSSAQGMRGGMRMMRGGSPAMLLQRDDVRTDLGLTDEQKDKLKDLQTSMQEKMQAAFMEMRNGGGQPDREAMRATFEKMMKEGEDGVNKILTPDQQKRLKEIAIQMDGAKAILKPDVAKAIGLTADQTAKAKALQETAADANQAIGRKIRNQEITMDEARAVWEKNDKALNAEIEKLLTDAQKAKLKEMGGKPFERKDEESGR